MNVAFDPLPAPSQKDIAQNMSSDKTILLIEDDREISSTIQGVLSAAGYEVIGAPNGIEGQKMIAQKSPALVITDMMMPRMGGFPILEYLKKLDDPPRVIMITANEGGRHKAYAEMLGVDDYLRKPFAMDLLIEAVEKAIGSAKGDKKTPLKPKRTTAKKKS